MIKIKDINSEVKISSLDYPDSVRENPRIYLSSINHCLNEIIDNSVDEYKAGYCNEIDIGIAKNGYITVKDNGRGIPVAPSEDAKHKGYSMAEIALSTLSAGGKFAGAENSYKEDTTGQNGVGSSCVNAISNYFEADIIAGGNVYQIIFENGRYKQRQKIISTAPKKVHGTIIKYKLDESFFPEDKLDTNAVITRCRQSAFLNPNLTFKIIIENEDGTTTKKAYCYQNGLEDYLSSLIKTKNVEISKNIFINKTVNDSKLGRPLVIDIALTYIDSYAEDLHAFVNSISSEDGGSHVIGFNNGICNALRQYAVEQKKIKNTQELEIGDTGEGLLGIVSIKIKKPTYDRQNKRKLEMPAIRTILINTVKDEFYDFLSKNPKDAEIILKKALRARSERLKVKHAREAARGIKEMTVKGVTLGKLDPCRTKDPSKAEILVVEGDSAAGSCSQGRDSEYQAVLPIFGKVINTEKRRVDEIINNDKLGLLIAALGCGIGKDFDIDKIKYHKIILFSDADVDGAHIRCLYMTFFYRYLPKVIEKGYLYSACPPLFRVVKKGQPDRYYYNAGELDKADTKGCTVLRFKGLGEMDPEELWNTSMNPASRKLHRITIEESEAAEEAIDICMGSNVAVRKDFIFENGVF